MYLGRGRATAGLALLENSCLSRYKGGLAISPPLPTNPLLTTTLQLHFDLIAPSPSPTTEKTAPRHAQ